MLQELQAEQIVNDLVRASRIFVAIAANSLVGDEEELSLQQYRALALLASREGQRPADLARSLGVTPSTTTALCDRLVQKGMISRRRRGSDRRSIFSSCRQGVTSSSKRFPIGAASFFNRFFCGSRHRRSSSLPRRSLHSLRLPAISKSMSGRSGGSLQRARRRQTGCSETTWLISALTPLATFGMAPLELSGVLPLRMPNLRSERGTSRVTAGNSRTAEESTEEGVVRAEPNASRAADSATRSHPSHRMHRLLRHGLQEPTQFINPSGDPQRRLKDL